VNIFAKLDLTSSSTIYTLLLTCSKSQPDGNAAGYKHLAVKQFIYIYIYIYIYIDIYKVALDGYLFVPFFTMPRFFKIGQLV
jgi:hypothetical protein